MMVLVSEAGLKFASKSSNKGIRSDKNGKAVNKYMILLMAFLFLLLFFLIKKFTHFLMLSQRLMIVNFDGIRCERSLRSSIVFGDI